MAKPQQGLLLGFGLGFGLIGLQGKGSCVEHGQDGTGLHSVPFLRTHFRHATTAIESQRDLADIHIAMQHQAVGRVGVLSLPPCRAGDGQGDGHDSDGNELLVVHDKTQLLISQFIHVTQIVKLRSDCFMCQFEQSRTGRLSFTPLALLLTRITWRVV